MVETIGIGICPECGALIRAVKLKKIGRRDCPENDALECPVCKKISSRYYWNIKDFLAG